MKEDTVNQKPIARRTGRAIQTLTYALVMAGSVCAASASVVTYQINSGGLESFNVQIDNTVINGALAGGILINQVSSNPSMPASYTTVCTDIEGTLYLGQSYQYETPVTPFSGQTGLDPKWGIPSGNGSAAQAAIQNAAYLFYTYGQLTGTGIGLSSTTQKAALQLAVWEALYNTTTSGQVITGSGARFTITSGDQAAINQANAWVAVLNGNYGLTGYLLTPATSNNKWWTDGKPPQELLYGVVPEAPTVIAGALLLLPFAASTFKILRKKRTA